ncbi:hypothetical protein L596_018090 [Steinernema carpocapsae]|uniref:Uncharacterized protein n=1 Tax=Steinernema carpocapsae TaxID=34508 RepID=A0A4U5N3V2_STECR|nr:hypothetical protein L596_018090 [Steinernema carpocapsae]
MDFDNHMEHLNFYEDGYSILAKIYYIISKLIRVIANLPCCMRVSRSVALTLRFVRNHPRHHVLQSALLCYSAILDSLPKSIILSEMMSDVKEWAEFFAHLVENDERTKNDETTRKIAGAVFVQLSELFKD